MCKGHSYPFANLSVVDNIFIIPFLFSLYVGQCLLSVHCACHFGKNVHALFDLFVCGSGIVKSCLLYTSGVLKGDICFRDVTFEYEAGRPVLKNMSFATEAGRFTGIVGKTGAGKSACLGSK